MFIGKGRLIELDGPIALSASKICLTRKLPMVDSIILASTLMNNATFWTQDADFIGLESVKFTPKRKS